MFLLCSAVLCSALLCSALLCFVLLVHTRSVGASLTECAAAETGEKKKAKKILRLVDVARRASILRLLLTTES